MGLAWDAIETMIPMNSEDKLKKRVHLSRQFFYVACLCRGCALGAMYGSAAWNYHEPVFALQSGRGL